MRDPAKLGLCFPRQDGTCIATVSMKFLERRKGFILPGGGLITDYAPQWAEIHQIIRIPTVHYNNEKTFEWEVLYDRRLFPLAIKPHPKSGCVDVLRPGEYYEDVTQQEADPDAPPPSAEWHRLIERPTFSDGPSLVCNYGCKNRYGATRCINVWPSGTGT